MVIDGEDSVFHLRVGNLRVNKYTYLNIYYEKRS